uniref:Retrotransposon gag domain-containing protein n=1 Tax=Fagus sylvatica TaxID=28930 RepID=A0A2N9FIH3_FAGSY
MEAMRRQIAVLTEQFQKYKPPQPEPEPMRQQPQAPPFMGYHRDFDQQWAEQNQNQRYEPRPQEGEDCGNQAQRESICLVGADSNPTSQIWKEESQDWSKMKKKLQEQFLPFNYRQTLYKNLHNLRQVGSVDDYTEKFLNSWQE